MEGPQQELGALGSGFCVAFIPEPRMLASVGGHSLEMLIQPCPSPKNLKSQPSPWGGRVTICAVPLFLFLGSVLSTAHGSSPFPPSWAPDSWWFHFPLLVLFPTSHPSRLLVLIKGSFYQPRRRGTKQRVLIFTLSSMCSE